MLYRRLILYLYTSIRPRSTTAFQGRRLISINTSPVHYWRRSPAILMSRPLETCSRFAVKDLRISSGLDLIAIPRRVGTACFIIPWRLRAAALSKTTRYSLVYNLAGVAFTYYYLQWNDKTESEDHQSLPKPPKTAVHWTPSRSSVGVLYQYLYDPPAKSL